MGLTNRLVFDPTDANSIAASSSVGAYVRAADGDLITSTLLGAKESLDVNVAGLSATDIDIRDLTHVSDSVSLGDGTTLYTGTTNGADHGLDVNLINDSISVTQGTSPWVVSATDLDIRDLVYTQDSVTSYQGGSWTVGISGDVNVTQGTDPWVVSATDLDIRDLTHVSDSVSLGDGTTLYTGTTVGADHGLDVNIIGGDIDDDLADTAIENATTAVSTTAVNVVTSALAARKWLYLYNMGNKELYFGKTGVTAANGFPMYPDTSMELRIGPSVTPQIIGGTGASAEDLRVMELS